MLGLSIRVFSVSLSEVGKESASSREMRIALQDYSHTKI